MKAFAFLLFTASLVFAQAGRYEPVHKPRIIVPSNVPLVMVQRALRNCLQTEGWKVYSDKAGSGYILAQHNTKLVDIRIEYSGKEVNVLYLKSRNMMKRTEDGEMEVRSEYNGWVRKLENRLVMALRRK